MTKLLTLTILLVSASACSAYQLKPCSATWQQSYAYSLAPQQSITLEFEHNQLHQPLVTVDAGTDAVTVKVFAVGPVSAWITVKNDILPPGAVIDGTVTLRIWGCPTR